MDWNTLTAGKGVAGSIANWLNNSTITQAVASSIIQEAESWVYRRLRHWRMEAAPSTGTLEVGSDQLALPADFLEPKNLWLTGINFARIGQRTEEEVIASWSYDGAGARVQQQPTIYFFNAEAIQFDSPADQAYPYALTYYAQPAALSGANASNWLTSTYPRLFRAAVMMSATEWAKDSGVGSFDRTYWIQVAEGELQVAQVESDRARRGTVAAVQFIGGGPSDPGY